MSVLDYFQPKTVAEAVGYLSQSPQTTKILAGGTDLIIQLREGTIKPDYILDLGYVPELQGIKEVSGCLVIGSMTTFNTIEDNPLVCKYLPWLAQASGIVGSPQIRNTGTIGGNLVNAAPAADTVPVLLAMEATAVLTSSHGDREVAIADLLVGINEINIANDEILAYLVIPIPDQSTFGSFVKIGRRKALAIARINLGLVLSFADNGEIGKAALALGAVGTTAYRVKEVEDFLLGKYPSAEVFAAAGEIISQVVAAKLGSRPTVSYKRTIAKACLNRALAQIGTECGGW